jgi:hypothetical protein
MIDATNSRTPRVSGETDGDIAPPFKTPWILVFWNFTFAALSVPD